MISGRPMISRAAPGHGYAAVLRIRRTLVAFTVHWALVPRRSDIAQVHAERGTRTQIPWLQERGYQKSCVQISNAHCWLERQNVNHSAACRKDLVRGRVEICPGSSGCHGDGARLYLRAIFVNHCLMTYRRGIAVMTYFRGRIHFNIVDPK